MAEPNLFSVAGDDVDNNDTFVPSSPAVGNPWRIKHPVVTFLHLLFRTLALIGN